MNWYKKAKIQEMNCPECGAKLEFVPNGQYGPYYKCEKNCGVTHGAWENGDPKGVPGDLETINLRKAAHKKFDQLWKNEPNPKEARNKAYEWLSRKMGCPKHQCHISMFNKTQLQQVIGICEHILKKKQNINEDQLKLF
jgi:endogenous inhibitor of DNA gyrase (YacG/DUF329 family)